jgi:hypothetical protein
MHFFKTSKRILEILHGLPCIEMMIPAPGFTGADVSSILLQFLNIIFFCLMAIVILRAYLTSNPLYEKNFSFINDDCWCLYF